MPKKRNEESVGRGLKRLRAEPGDKPTVKCDNCGCMRYTTCGCKRKSK